MNLKRMFSKISMMHPQPLKVIADSLDPLFSFRGKQTSGLSRIVIVGLTVSPIHLLCPCILKTGRHFPDYRWNRKEERAGSCLASALLVFSQPEVRMDVLFGG